MSQAAGSGGINTGARDMIERAGTDPRAAERKGAALPLVPALLGLIGVCVFLVLGVWQLERRIWKLDLIARVDERVHASAVAAPGPDSWDGMTASDYEYRHVRLTGRFLGDANTLVQAVTELGGGYWVLTPMRTDGGFVVLVNRGFVPQERKAEFERENTDAMPPATVDGLLRISEPGGGFLRKNDAPSNRWYSRDVAAIAKARGLSDVAPYFVDASGTDGWPRGGLTVVHFRNSHLVYALTWFALAAMLAIALAASLSGHRRRAAAG